MTSIFLVETGDYLIMKRIIKWLAAVLITLTWVVPPEGGSMLACELQRGVRISTEEIDLPRENPASRSLPKMQFFYNQERIVK